MKKLFLTMLLMSTICSISFSQSYSVFGGSWIKDSTGYSVFNKGISVRGNTRLQSKLAVGTNVDANYKVIIQSATDNLLKLRYDDGMASANTLFKVDDAGMLTILSDYNVVQIGEPTQLGTLRANDIKIYNSTPTYYNLDDKHIYGNFFHKDSANTFLAGGKIRMETGTQFFFDFVEGVSDRDIIFSFDGTPKVTINDINGLTTDQINLSGASPINLTSAGSTTIGLETNYDLGIKTNNTVRLFVDKSGDVSLGTSNGARTNMLSANRTSVNNVLVNQVGGGSPATQTKETTVQLYMVGSKLIARYLDASSVEHFFYIDLNTTANSQWIYSATEP